MSPSSSLESKAAPTDEGEKLATIDRGPGKQLRIRAKVFNEHPYIDIRVWDRRDENSAWWPTKKGVSIKPRELADVIAALKAVGLAKC